MGHREGGAGGRRGLGRRWGSMDGVGARSWADRPWKFPLYVSALFRMGGVLELEFGFVCVGGGVVGLGFGDLAARQPQQEAW